MKHTRHILRTLVLTVALLAAGQNTAQANEDTYTISWTVVGNESRLIIMCNGFVQFDTKVNKGSDSRFRIEFNQYSLRNSPYDLKLSGSLCYEEFGESTAVTDGEFEIYAESSTMKIKEVLVMTSLHTSSGDYSIMDIQTLPNDQNQVSFITPAEATIHLRAFKVSYIPMITLNDFRRLGDGIYEINTKEDLTKLALLVNEHYNDCSGITFRQTDNIDFGNEQFEMIGNVQYGDVIHPFKGTYDGQHYSISRITIPHCSTANEDSFKGVFSYVQDGTVQNVVLANSEIAGHYYIGGIVGLSHGGTVRNCRVTNVTIGSRSESQSHGGIVGKNEAGGAVIGCFSDARLTSDGTSSVFGGIAGFNDGIIQDCLFSGSVIEASRQFGSIVGVNNGTLTNNYYDNNNNNIGGLNNVDVVGACRAHEIQIKDTNVAIDGSLTPYDVSGLTAIGTSALSYAISASTKKIYSGEGQKIGLIYTGNVPAGSAPAYRVNGTRIAGNSFTMPATDVAVISDLVAAPPINVTGHFSDGVYWSTFCHEVLRYALPEGATAYTMDAEHHLYRLGDDGRVIPAGVAVVIVADKENITLTYDSSTTEITDHAPGYVNNTLTDGNILQGSNDPVPVSSITTGTPHVLGVAGGVFGFHPYVPTGTDTSIPAHKAFYVQ